MYNIGQKLRVVSLGKIGTECSNWIEKDNLVIGQIVTIKRICSFTNRLEVMEGLVGFEIDYRHFEPILEYKINKHIKKHINLRRD